MNDDQSRKRRRESNNEHEGPRRRPTMDEIEKLLTCPISHDIMRDPVTLEKSGHVFDRENLCQCLSYQEPDKVSSHKYGLRRKASLRRLYQYS
jgi:hypothetical protein